MHKPSGARGAPRESFRSDPSGQTPLEFALILVFVVLAATVGVRHYAKAINTAMEFGISRIVDDAATAAPDSDGDAPAPSAGD